MQDKTPEAISLALINAIKNTTIFFFLLGIFLIAFLIVFLFVAKESELALFILFACIFLAGICAIIFALYSTLQRKENRSRDTATSLQAVLVPVWIGILLVFIFSSSTFFNKDLSNQASQKAINNSSSETVLSSQNNLTKRDSKQNPLKTLSITLSIGGSSLVFGSFFGILFGIPRSAQRRSERNEFVLLSDKNTNEDKKQKNGLDTSKTSSTNRYSDNTNIEEISDWLTKIIIGIGLVQLRTIPDILRSLTNSLNKVLGDGNGIFGISIILLLSISGFFIGYLCSRLFLPGAFTRTLLHQLDQKQSELDQKQSDISEIINERDSYDYLVQTLLAKFEEENLSDKVFKSIDILLKNDDGTNKKLDHICGGQRSLKGFLRGSDEHRQLRKLRSNNLIRPKEGHSWQANKEIQLTSLGKAYCEYKKANKS